MYNRFAVGMWFVRVFFICGFFASVLFASVFFSSAVCEAVETRDEFFLDLPERSHERLFIREKETIVVSVDYQGTKYPKTIPVYHVDNEQDIYGVLTRVDGELYGTLINPSQEELIDIAPSPAAVPSAIASKAVSYQTMKIALGDHPRTCALMRSELKPGNTELPGVMSVVMGDPMLVSSGPWRRIDLVAVAPTEFTAKRTETQVVAQIVNAVATANMFYGPLRLSIRLNGIALYDQPELDPYLEPGLRQDPHQMLKAVEKNWKEKSQPKRDVVAVFGRGKYRNVFGLAYRGTSCVSKRQAVLFATQGGVATALEANLGSTLAHELGHIIGMGHDSTPTSSLDSSLGPSLMSPVFHSRPTGFSGYSVNQFLGHAGPGKEGGRCFREIPTPGAFNQELSFIGGPEESIEILEGQTFVRAMKLVNIEKGVSYDVSFLPSGASFDPVSAMLTYQPDFSVASPQERYKEMVLDIQANYLGQTALKKLRFRIIDVSRPRARSVPRIVSIGRGGSKPPQKRSSPPRSS